MTGILLFLASAFAGILEVDIIDVGQGDSILILSPAGKAVLIDAGTGRQGDVVGHLKSRGVEELNLMVGTHPHADHIGGLDEVMEALPVKLFLDNGLPHTTRTYETVMGMVEEKKISYLKGKAGRVFKLDDGIRLELIHPQDKALTNTRSDLNSNSVVIRLTHGDVCFLFTGDAEEPTEDILVQKGIEPCQVLKVAHHGSNHSSSEHFIKAVNPEIALISAGEGNRYNHPGAETMARLASHGLQIYRTDQMGTIRLQSDGSQVTVLTGGTTEPMVARSSKPRPKEKPTSSKLLKAEQELMVALQSYSKALEAESGEPLARDQLQSKTLSLVHGFFGEGAGAVSGATSPQQNGFNLNTATASQLETVPGIGSKKAASIIEFRQKNGPFKRHTDLQQIAGIGPATVKKIAESSYIE
jgi:competence protein ComEC